MHSVNSVGSLISYCVAIMTALVTLSTKVSGVDTTFYMAGRFDDTVIGQLVGQFSRNEC